MKILQKILLIPLLLANIKIASSHWWNSSANYLHARSPVRTVNNNGIRMTEGGHVDLWLLRIMNGDEFVCGASYFSALYALTSSNCMHAHKSMLRSLSVEFLMEQNNQESAGESSVAGIQAVFVSKEWSWPETYMDVAVLKLTNRLRGNHFAKLCSKPLSSHSSLSVVACGGPTENIRSEGITVLNRMNCESNYGRVILGETIACAKEFKKSPGCMFDPGCPVSSGQELCGIVAWGPACKRGGLPGIFTDIHQVRKFILKVTSGRGRNRSHRQSHDTPEWHSGFW
ncbi:seminase [Drosophila ficusphila]|uniref:seminase n=1 Tax=Drosophila ficusphila TaxID=30025 RepID=UPI0007E88ABE|nr:seminase [Drosophila ficusphila]